MVSVACFLWAGAWAQSVHGAMHKVTCRARFAGCTNAAAFLLCCTASVQPVDRVGNIVSRLVASGICKIFRGGDTKHEKFAGFVFSFGMCDNYWASMVGRRWLHVPVNSVWATCTDHTMLVARMIYSPSSRNLVFILDNKIVLIERFSVVNEISNDSLLIAACCSYIAGDAKQQRC